MLLRNVGVYAVTDKGECRLIKYNGMPAPQNENKFFVRQYDKPEFAKVFEETTLFMESDKWINQKILPEINNKDKHIVSYKDLETEKLPGCQADDCFFYCKYVDYLDDKEKEKLKIKDQKVVHPGYLYVLACNKFLLAAEVFDLLHNLEAIHLDGPESIFILDNMIKDTLRFVGKNIIIVNRKTENIHREVNLTKDVLFEAKDRLKVREEMLDQLLDDSEKLLESATLFAESAKRVNQSGCCGGVSYVTGAVAGGAIAVKNKIIPK